MSLIDDAAEVCRNAYAPYSNFRVGAAVRAASGRVYRGCNVENIAYPEGTCAEASAIAAMVAGGDREIAEVAVISEGPKPITPCGGCRQKLAEFAAADVAVVMATTAGAQTRTTVGDLLPGGFAAAHMGGG